MPPIGSRQLGRQRTLDTPRRRARGRLGALSILLGGLGFTPACSDDDDQADSANAVENFVIALEATIDVECACEQVSSQTCASAKQSLRQCVNDAVGSDAAGGDPLAPQRFPTCAAQAVRDYNACLRLRGRCSEGRIEGLETCDADLQASTCEVPASVQPCLSGAGPAPADTPAPGDTPDPPSDVCNDSCVFDGGSVAGDGDCDDGRPGADYDICELGTDCTDCGPARDSN
jgi:hypothetical protein